MIRRKKAACSSNLCLRGSQTRGPCRFWHQVFDFAKDLEADCAEIYYILLRYNLEEGTIGLTLRREDENIAELEYGPAREWT